MNTHLLVMLALSSSFAAPSDFIREPAPEPRPSSGASDDQYRKLVQREAENINKRTDLIEQELDEINRTKTSDAPWAIEWAGTYESGDGLGMNVTISIAPKAGLSYTWHGCGGLYDGNYGEIIETLPDGVRVRLAINPALSDYGFMSERLYFVRWGEHRYLVPETQMFNMIAAYDKGVEDAASVGNAPHKLPPRMPEPFRDPSFPSFALRHANLIKPYRVLQPPPREPLEMPVVFAKSLRPPKQ